MWRPICIRWNKLILSSSLTLALPALFGCEGNQSILSPYGDSSARIATLGWIMFSGSALIFLLVLALIGCKAIVPSRESKIALI